MVRWILLVWCFLSSALLAIDDPVIVLVGAPGSGKGTFSQLLKERYGFSHVSAGDLVRLEIQNETPIGLEIREIVKSGNFINSQIMHTLIRSKIYELEKEKKPLIIDNFCRSEEDIAFLYDLLGELHLLENTFVLSLDASDAVCKERIRDRMVCSTCAHVYNLKSHPPGLELVCDVCKSSLSIRINDSAAVIEKRLADYRQKVEPGYSYLYTLFPTIFLFAEKSIDECYCYYESLVEGLKDAKSAKEFCAKEFVAKAA